MDSCWILGAGRFGRKALAALSRKYPEAAITVIDRDGDAVSDAPAALRITVVRGEAMAYMAEHLAGAAGAGMDRPGHPGARGR